MNNVNTYIKENAYMISKSWAERDSRETNNEIIEKTSSFFDKIVNKIENTLSDAVNSKVLIAPIDKKCLDNASKAFNCDDFSSIIAIFDHTLSNSCDEGLLFTGTRMIQKTMLSDPVVFIYENMQSAEYGQKYETDKNGEPKLDYEYVEVKFKNPEEESIIIKGLHDCDYEFLEKFINKILEHENFKDENQLKIIADMPDPLKIAYLKVIINAALSNDNKIDEKEFAEIFLLMDRVGLEAGKEPRFEVRAYMSEASLENLTDIKDLLEDIKSNSDGSQLKSIMISLVKDITNIYFTGIDEFNAVSAKDVNFIQNNKMLLGLNDNDIELAVDTIKQDYSILYNNLDDDKIKSIMKDLSAKATSVGVPLGAVYISGSVLGLSAAGMTSGLATLGMGGLLGLSSMATGIGVAILMGVGVYQGVRYLTGANQVSNYKQREIMLHEAIKQTQKSICNIIEVLKLNDVKETDSNKNQKIQQLEKMIKQFVGAAKSMTLKQDRYENSANKLQCPDLLDVSRLKRLTSDPTNEPMFKLVINNYEEVEVVNDGNKEKVVKLKDNIDTQTLEKIAEIFNAVGYFDVGNILKGKAQDGLDKFTDFAKGILR